MTGAQAAARAPGRASGLADLRMIARQVRYEQLSFWLNPLAAIFTVGFSVIFLVLLGASAGTSRVGFLGHIKLIQYYVPGFVAYGVMSACFNTLATMLVNRRETGLLKRERLSPLPTWALLGGVFGSTLLVSLIQVILLLAVGRIGFGVQLPYNLGAFAFALVTGALCFIALGTAVSTLIPNADAAGPVTSIVFFVLLFLSGLWFPLQKGSGLAQFAKYFPIRPFINAVFAPFNHLPGTPPWDWQDLRALAIWGVAALVVAVRRFSWAPHRN